MTDVRDDITEPPRKKSRKDREDSKQRSYSWCFTINNPTDEIIRRLESLDCKRIVVGAEVAPTTGTAHLQGYVRFPAACRFSWWKNQFPTAHVEIRRGTEEEATTYCKKDGRILIDKGHDLVEGESVDKMTRDQKALRAIVELENGASLASVRRLDKVFFFWNQRQIRDYKNSLVTDPD